VASELLFASWFVQAPFNIVAPYINSAFSQHLDDRERKIDETQKKLDTLKNILPSSWDRECKAYLIL